MVDIAIALGVYGYLVFALGLLGRLGKLEVLLATIPFGIFGVIRVIRGIRETKINQKKIKDKLVFLLVGILGFQILINFLGAISPELSFDALWYHLTPAKLYAQNHRIFYLPGWLMWPANLPRLGDMYYTVALLFSNEIFAKLIHFMFGVLGMISLFGLLRRYLSLRFTLFGLVTFYTMLIVGWQSTTAYVDLIRLFFEILALDLFLQWYDSKKDSFLLDCGVIVGLAISTKILAFGTLAALGILVFILGQGNFREKVIRVFKSFGLTLLIIFPWFIFLYFHTRDIVIPNQVSGGSAIMNLVHNFTKLPLLLWNATLKPDDIISPIYLIFLPLVLILIWKEKPVIKVIGLYFLINIFLTPDLSNRYLLPYLPALTLITFYLIEKRLNKFLIITGLIIFASLLNLGSRTLATRKFLPYLFGKQSKAEFLSNNLNFSFGDFYDVDGWFMQNIQKNDLILVYGIHNLYYLNFPYIHESWAKQGTYFSHILVGNNEQLPNKFGERLLIYQNRQTGVKVYLFGEKL